MISRRKRSVMTSEKRVELIKKVVSVIPKSVECTEYQASKTTLSDIIKA